MGINGRDFFVILMTISMSAIPILQLYFLFVKVKQFLPSFKYLSNNYYIIGAKQRIRKLNIYIIILLIIIQYFLLIFNKSSDLINID